MNRDKTIKQQNRHAVIEDDMPENKASDALKSASNETLFIQGREVKGSYASRFSALLVAQFLGALNDNVFKNALVILITFSLAEQAGVSVQTFVVLAGALFILPFFLFSSTTGQLSDKYAKDKVMKLTKFAEIVIMILGLLALMSENIAFLLFVLFLLGLQSTVFSPAKYAVLPELLEDRQLVRGNGHLNALTFLAILLGTIAGGELVLLNNGTMIIGYCSIAFAVIGWLVSLKIPKLQPKDAGHKIDWNIFTTTIKMIREVKVFSRRKYMSMLEKHIAVTILCISWFWFVGASFLSMLAPYVKEVLNGNEHMVTLLLTGFALGIGIGSTICHVLKAKFPNVYFAPISLLVMSLFGVDIYFATGQDFQYSVFSFGRIVFDFMMIAISAGVYVVPLESKLQKIAPDKKRARIIASMNIINALFMVMSAVVLMAFAALGVGITLSFVIISLANAVLAVVLFRSPILKKRWKF